MASPEDNARQIDLRQGGFANRLIPAPPKLPESLKAISPQIRRDCEKFDDDLKRWWQNIRGFST